MSIKPNESTVNNYCGKVVSGLNCSNTTQIKRNRSIDGLRAYAALLIVFMHVLANGNYKLSGFVFDNIIPSFTDLVFLFMTISAYAMCCGYYEKFLNKEISITHFYSKRYKRILPFFAALCLLDFIVGPSLDSLYEVFANITLCFGLLPNPNMSVIGVGWFLGLIFVFYIAFPFFCYLISSKRKAWIVFVIALIFNILCNLKFGAGRSNIIYCAMFFVAGGLIYLYRDKLANIKLIYRIGILLCSILAYTFYLLVYSNSIVVLIISVLLILYAISGKSILLDNPVTRFISNISMEIYLSHMLIFRIVEKMRLAGIFKNHILSYLVVSVVTVLGAIAFSWSIKYVFNLIQKVVIKIKTKNTVKS